MEKIEDVLSKKLDKPLFEEAASVDFETFYSKEYSLTKLSPDEYVNDERFDPYCVAIRASGSNPIQYFGPVKDAPWAKVLTRPLIAHNARFDYVVLNRCKQMGLIPDLEPISFDCTADLAVYFKAKRNLQQASRSLLNVNLDKGYRGLALGKTWSDFTEEEKEEIRIANIQDAEACLALWRKFGQAWPEEELLISRLNRMGGMKGVSVHSERLNDGIEKLSKLKFKMESIIPWEWDENKTPNSFLSIAKQCKEQNIPAPENTKKDSEEFEEWLNLYSDEAPWAEALGTWRRADTLIKRLLTLRNVSKGGDLPFTFSILYQGAHTGRLAGENKFNMQNMNRLPIFDVDLRGMLVPRKGYVFVISDLAQIEPRIVNWVAGNKEFLRLCEAGVSPYEAHAIQSNMWDPEKGSLKAEAPHIYSLAKARVLALGYGAGWFKFITMVRSLGMNPLELFAGAVDDFHVHAFLSFLKKFQQKQHLVNFEKLREQGKHEICDMWVNSWLQVSNFRANNPLITGLWRTLHEDMLRAATSKDKLFELELPSGRSLYYFNPTYFEDELRAKVGLEGGFFKFYGGKLIENMGQAIGRDVFFHNACLAYTEHGLPFSWTVHDEGIWEVPISTSDKDAEKIHACMSTRPAWAKSLPVAAETLIADRFKK